jgi:dihydrofolate synthase / folylpolyglutamate synthase
MLMFNAITDLVTYFQDKVSPTYTREHLDRFLSTYSFHFTIPAIHITGTNGKGSTATFLRNIYQTRFKKVGLFTSPALSRFQEMIYINHEEITDRYVLNFFNHWQPMFEAFHLTAFEMQTLLAFHYFHDQGCDFAIIEVGMGGKIDATNMFTPVLSIITNISLEHQAYLGNTVEKIAEHKAGIIKPHVPVLVGPLPPGALAVVTAVAQAQGSPLFQRAPYHISNTAPITFDYEAFKSMTLTMRAVYQVDNATLALAATKILASRYPVNEVAIKEAIHHTFMPGRLEVVKQSPLIIIDGAHNPGGIQALIRAMGHHQHQPIAILFAAFKDKEVSPMLTSLTAISKTIVVTSFPHPRARKKADYPSLVFPYIDAYQDAISVLTKTLPKHGVLLITGSLAFAGLVRQEFLKK